MTVTVKNFGCMQVADTNGKSTKTDKVFGEVGTVTVEVQGIKYVFAPNQSKTFSDDGIAAAVIAGSGSRLRATGAMDGGPWIFNSAPSLPVTKW
jgi:predicted naringenin-chalcone synthase